MRLPGKEFCVSGKRNPGIVNDAFMDGRGDYAGKLAGLASLSRTNKQIEHIPAVCRIQPSGFYRL
jgi:hypothetical protein